MAGKSRVEDVAAFFVAKKDERIRMVLVCRRSNQRFFSLPRSVSRPRDSPTSRCPRTPRSTSRGWTSRTLSTNASCPPNYLRPLFCLPVVTAGELGISRLDGRRVPPWARPCPQQAVAPMGWSWALYFVQKAHERVLDQYDALRPELRAVDFAPVPRPLSEPIHSLYVDNVLVVGTDQEAVTRVRRLASQALVAAGLAVHGETDATESMTMLGGQLEGWPVNPIFLQSP